MYECTGMRCPVPSCPEESEAVAKASTPASRGPVWRAVRCTPRSTAQQRSAAERAHIVSSLSHTVIQDCSTEQRLAISPHLSEPSYRVCKIHSSHSHLLHALARSLTGWRAAASRLVPAQTLFLSLTTSRAMTCLRRGGRNARIKSHRVAPLDRAA